MKNKYVRQFLLRGLIFGGFGPIIMGIVYLILSFCIEDFSVSGINVFTATISIYILAFIQAGCSVFNQIEHWSVPKATLFHFSFIYAAYVLCYLVNSWIPFEPLVLLIFTASFVVAYFIIWITVALIVKSTVKKLNSKLK